MPWFDWSWYDVLAIGSYVALVVGFGVFLILVITGVIE
jgi:hypothetical protein